MSLWTSAAIAAATGGHATRDFDVQGIEIDSRKVAPGELFIALAAARDGHDFVADALSKGAAGALVSRIPDGLDDTAPLVIVDDVQTALEDLGRAGRARMAGRVIAITGSVGKTSTKEMLRAALTGQGAIHAAEASYNNHWGVPLTLARMPAATDFAIIEIGMNHPGEIAPLAAIARPHVAMITTIAPAHLEAFDSIDDIAREKAAIFSGLEPGGVAVIPQGLGTTPVLMNGAGAARIIGFGTGVDDDWRLTRATPAQGRMVIEAEAAGQPFVFKLATTGRHFALNGLGALAAADAAGADAAISAIHIADWQPVAGRGLTERIVLDAADPALSFDLIDDAYNANPVSLAAALEVLATATPRDGIGRIRKGRRIAILGDMLELGADEMAQHEAMADHPALADVAVVHCVGPRMFKLWNALPRDKRGEWVQAATSLAAVAGRLVDAGDVVLVKGSKGIRVSLVVDALRKLRQGETLTAGSEGTA
ncbi:UDP-N-acetylmuramoyl-tripeptide--D-alanyl-D-alanine ligase [Paracoccus sp. p3-h83]|uniref:UDP-N-acetylmuramoyl-tripeptide--D-alanyl-D- alanine ligase n=1 Tax=Paracoccus sp. p3-h83 TaxID=3342805 RepID=UPI0035B80195